MIGRKSKRPSHESSRYLSSNNAGQMTVPGQALKVVVSFGSAFLAAFLLFFLSGLALDEASLSEFWAPGAYSNASSVLFVIAHRMYAGQKTWHA